jgi:hypothetical protein
MSLLERHRYMINRLAEAFGHEDTLIERMMLQPEVLQAINHFLSADGPTKILVSVEFIEIVEEVKISSNASTSSAGSGDDEEEEEPEEPLTHRLKIFTEEIEYIPPTTVFFMKNRRPKDGEVRYAIDTSKNNDGTLSFGVMRAPLESLESMMRCVYKPMIQNMGQDSWGQASAEHKLDLITSIDSFTKGLQESIRSISGGLELKKPDERVESMGASAAADPSLVVHCLNLLQEWCIRIEKYLDDSDRTRWETPDSGPDTELVYWRNRTQR